MSPSESRLLEHTPQTWKLVEMSTMKTDKPEVNVAKDR